MSKHRPEFLLGPLNLVPICLLQPSEVLEFALDFLEVRLLDSVLLQLLVLLFQTWDLSRIRLLVVLLAVPVDFEDVLDGYEILREIYSRQLRMKLDGVQESEARLLGQRVVGKGKAEQIPVRQETFSEKDANLIR